MVYLDYNCLTRCNGLLGNMAGQQSYTASVVGEYGWTAIIHSFSGGGIWLDSNHTQLQWWGEYG